MAENIVPFEESLKKSGLLPFRAIGIEIFQMNLGKLCNQACKHCHVNAGPDRTELMSDEIIEESINLLERSDIPVLDITGGAPEMHPRYRHLVERAREMGKKVLTRCNLTICLEKGYEDLPEFYKKTGTAVVASLPYFRQEETDRTRGRGTFEKSIKVLKKLNELGYGMADSGLELDLVYNPSGIYFPPPQATLETDFKRELRKRFDIEFTSLFTIFNMPIGRFADYLQRTRNFDSYMKRLVDAYNPTAAHNVMCRNTISIDWRGYLYDCDFNQMLDIRINHGAPSHIKSFDFQKLADREIMIGPHCYGCTAGSGSSCGGATTE